jgi:hypothetical protein
MFISRKPTGAANPGTMDIPATSSLENLSTVPGAVLHPGYYHPTGLLSSIEWHILNIRHLSVHSMKAIAVLCILCLLIVGTVSAATINAALITSANKPASVVAVNRLTAITFDSNVHGATVYLDDALVGSDEAHSKTPVTDNLVTTGNHTATFRLSGYKESVVPFYVEAGKPRTIYAQLQPSLIAIARQVKPINTIQQVQHPVIQAVAMSTPSTTVPSPTPTLLPCPSGYLCESLAAAQSAYGADGYTKYGDLPCNYTTARAYSKEQVKEYCIKPAEKSLKRITLNPMIIKPVGGVQNPVGIVKPVPALPVAAIHSPPVITHVAVVDSFLDVVSSGIWGIFGKPVSQQPAIPADVCVCQPPFFCSDGTNAHGDPCNCNTCNGRCVDLSADKTNCGSCGYVCNPDYNCYNGECFWDVGRCGTAADCYFTTGGISDTVTEWQCVNSYCDRTCKAGYLSCKLGTFDVCRDILNDNYNCGSCDRLCLYSGYACQNGECKMVN